MKFCEEADIINEIFTWPLGGPSWARIYNNGKVRAELVQEYRLLTCSCSPSIKRATWKSLP